MSNKPKRKMDVTFLVTGDSLNAKNEDSGSSSEPPRSYGSEVGPEEETGVAESQKGDGQKCPTCGKVLKFKGELLYHDHIHGVKECELVCEQCELGFTKRHTYRNHIKCVHNKEKRYKCPQCDKAFFFRKDLPKHVLAVHELAKPHKCPTCGRGFAKKEHMYRHLRTVHGTRSQGTQQAGPS